MVGAFGLDFGTSNSLVAHVRDGQLVRSFVDRDRNNMPHPSVVWYRAADVKVGFEARDELDGGAEAISGDFVRSPKRLLGGSATIELPGRKLSCWDPAARVLTLLKGYVATQTQADQLEMAVFTVPVSFNGAARYDLRQAAYEAGLRITCFVHEPLAALYAHLRASEGWRRRLAELNNCYVLVFDWGGGTLDLTLCQVSGQTLRQVANRCNSEVGGDRFDERIRNYVRQRHAEEHGLDDVRASERPNMAIKLLRACESAKIDLSTNASYPLLLRAYLDRSVSGRDLKITLSRDELDNVARPLVEEGVAEIERLLEEAGVSKEAVEFCLPIGGTVKMPSINSRIGQLFRGRVERTDYPERLIAEGAAWIAFDGALPTMAKPLEVEDASGSFVTILEAGAAMPFEGKSILIENSQFYCADPRDGIAVFRFVRPRRYGRHARSESRIAYASAIVQVDPWQQPLVERIILSGEIDDDYVLSLAIESTGRKHVQKLEIAELEFALQIGGERSVDAAEEEKQGLDVGSIDGAWQRTARRGRRPFLRSNVTDDQSAKHMVAGDIVRDYWPSALDKRNSSRQRRRQNAEAIYYQVCATCGRTAYVLTAEGCHKCGGTHSPDLALELAARRRTEASARMQKAIAEERQQTP